MTDLDLFGNQPYLTMSTMRICKRGHAVASGKCLECSRPSNRDYMRRLRKTDTERERERGRLWDREHVDRRRELNRKSRLKHIEKVREKEKAASRARRAANRERSAFESRQRYALLDNAKRSRRRAKNQAYMKRWREAHPEQARLARNAWAEKNPLREIEHDQRYRARKAAAFVAPVTDAFLVLLLESQAGRCLYCQIPLVAKKHLDHKVPLSRGGTHEPRNVCWACPRCNTSKRNKTADEFIAYREVCA